MASSAEAKAKWLHFSNHCIIDEDYKRGSRPPSFIPSSSKSQLKESSRDLFKLNNLSADTRWWLYQQDKVNDELEAKIGDTLQKKPKLPEMWTENDDMVDFDPYEHIVPDESDKLFSELESQWIGIKKNEPWWRIADLDSFVSHKSLQHLDNCDLPLPQTNKTDSMQRSPTSPRGLVKPFSTTHSNEVKNMETPNSNTQLSEALHNSQKRAMEAEKAVQEAYNEKEHVISLFLKQASQIFAYKQWLHILQLELLCLQLKRKRNQPIYYSHFRELISTKGKLPKRVHKKYKFKESVGEFLLGVALVGAGVLLGWTLGWLFPTSDRKSD